MECVDGQRGSKEDVRMTSMSISKTVVTSLATPRDENYFLINPAIDLQTQAVY